MRVMINLIISFLFLSCSGYDKQDLNIDKLVFIDKKLKCEISVEFGFLNYNIFYENEYLLNTKVKIDSLQMRKYKGFIISLSSNISKYPTNFYLKGGQCTYYLTSNDYLKESFLSFDSDIQLQDKINNSIFEMVNTLMKKEDYNKAFKVAEMSVFMKHPFYYGNIKDDRTLKIVSQKYLFDQGKKQEAIINLLKL